MKELDALQAPPVDELANFIRSIDGNHSMGAGALAEHICEWLNRRADTGKSAWISVDEALPDSEVSVLIAMKDGRIEKTCYYYGEFLRPSSAQPTHWMPLPAPPISAGRATEGGKEGGE